MWGATFALLTERVGRETSQVFAFLKGASTLAQSSAALKRDHEIWLQPGQFSESCLGGSATHPLFSHGGPKLNDARRATHVGRPGCSLRFGCHGVRVLRNLCSLRARAHWHHWSFAVLTVNTSSRLSNCLRISPHMPLGEPTLNSRRDRGP